MVRSAVFVYLFIISLTLWVDKASGGDIATGNSWFKSNGKKEFYYCIRQSEKLREVWPNEAIKYSTEALRIAQAGDNPDRISEALIAAAWDHYYAYQHKDVLQYCNRAEKMITRVGEDKVIKYKSKIYRIYASVFSELGLYDRALLFFSKSLPMMIEDHNRIEVCDVLMQIGMVYFRKGELDKYNFYNELALGISMKTGNFHTTAVILRDLGTGKLRSGKRSEAEYLFSRAIDYSRLSGDSAFYSFIAYNKGVYLREKGEADSSIAQLKLAVIDFKKLNNRRMTGFSLAEISYVFLDIGKMDSAYHYYHLTETADRESQSPRLHQRLLELGIDLNRKQEKNKEALLLSLEYKNYSDSIVNVRESDRSGAFEKLYLSEKEYYETLKENEKIRQNQRFFVLVLILIVFVVGMIIYFILQYFRRKVKSEKQEKERVEEHLEQKNRELAVEMMNSLKKRELFMKIDQGLDEFSRCESSEELHGKIHNLKTEIKREGSSDVWKEFEKRFSDVHVGYLDRLLKKYPKLTPNEIKLCAFLKLNLSSKQISELTGQQVSAIELGRIRLRKKLGIANTKINLVSFLSGF